MQLNLKKCEFKRYVRKNSIPANYAFDGYQLELLDNFLDLGTPFDFKLNFISHITIVELP